MTADAKQRAVQATYAKLATPQAVRTLGGAANVANIRGKLKPLENAFMNANVPATAELGRADADALAFKDYQSSTFGAMSVEDVGAMQSTIDPNTRKGTGAGAADVAQFLESLRRDSRLQTELPELEATFLTAYRKAVPAAKTPDWRAAQHWYEAATEIERISRGEPNSAARLTLVLGESP